jgi:hypothetical protein
MLRTDAFCVVIGSLGLVVALQGSANPGTPPTLTKAPVDQLIAWLLDEDRQLQGIPFGDVIFDAAGQRVLPTDAKNEA